MSKYKHGTSWYLWTRKFFLSFPQRLDLKNSEKYVALQNLTTVQKRKVQKRQQYKNKKLKIITATLNDEFELLDGSYSMPDIQDYIEYIVKTWNINTQSSYSYLYQQE